jgi:salicylate hydroxylase
VVVGAGIGGLTASLVLSRVAARVTLVERAERPSEVGAALALQPNGMAVLDRLGLLPAVEAVARGSTGWTFEALPAGGC